LVFLLVQAATTTATTTTATTTTATTTATIGRSKQRPYIG
jgi:hypothetical protein